MWWWKLNRRQKPRRVAVSLWTSPLAMLFPASDASEDKRAGKVGEPVPPDRVLEALEQAASVVTGTRPDDVANGIEKDLGTFLEQLLPEPPRRIPEDTCARPDRQIAPFCHQLKLSYQQVKLTYEGATNAASAALRSALGTWSMAVSAYESNLANADSTLRQEVAAAIKSYEEKNNPDLPSRSLFLYFTLKQAVAAAIQMYEGSASSARATLAGAAGSLLDDYQAYVDAINRAQSQRLCDEATADQSFWQAVEAVRDSV